MSYEQHEKPTAEAEAAVRLWRDWIKRIEDDVVAAVSNQRCWEELNAIWRRNHALLVPTDAREWIARMHADSAALAVRKQLDRDRNSVSLWRLLDDLERRARYMTLDAHLADVQRDGMLERIVAQRARNWLEQGTAHLDPAIVAADMKHLQEEGQLARDWANHEAAHADEKGARKPVTYGDLARALKCVEHLVMKYVTILTCTGFVAEMGLLPHRQFDESLFFRRPWHKAGWGPRRWPEGWVERTGEMEPSFDVLERGNYLQLARARHAIVERLRQSWQWGATAESPIRTVLEALALPASDAAVLWVRDRLLQRGYTWNGTRAPDV